MKSKDLFRTQQNNSHFRILNPLPILIILTTILQSTQQTLQDTIIPRIKTNLDTYNVYIADQDTNLRIDAWNAYNSSTTKREVECQWEFSEQIMGIDDQLNSCSLVITKSNINLNSKNSYFDIATLRVLMKYQETIINKTQTFYLTIINRVLEDNLPLCKIDTFHDGYIDPYDYSIFYPKCFKKSSSTSQNITLDDLDYWWTINPFMDSVSTYAYTLVIDPYYLLNKIQDPLAGFIDVTLTVYSNSMDVSYDVTVRYPIPKFYTSTLNNYINTSPAQGQALINPYNIELLYYTLTNNQYLRVRIDKKDSTSDILIHSSNSNNFNLYFPKQTKKLYIDVIENQYENCSDYNIYQIKAVDFQIVELSFISNLIFQKIVAKLDSPLNISYADIGAIDQNLDYLLGIDQVLDGVRTSNKAFYFSMLFNKVETIYLNIVTEDQQYSMKDLMRFKQKILAIFASLRNQLDQGYDELNEKIDDYLFDDFASNDTIDALINSNTMLTIRYKWADSILALITTDEYEYTAQEYLNRIYIRILLSCMVEGEEQEYNPIQNFQKGVIYQLTEIEKQLDSGVQLSSPLGNDKSTTVEINSLLLSDTTYINTKWNENQYDGSVKEVGNQFVISKSDVIARFYDQNYQQIDKHITQSSFTVTYDFKIHERSLREIEVYKNYTQMIFCANRQQYDQNFTYNVSDIITNLDNIGNGFVTCQSKLPGIFTILFVPIIWEQGIQEYLIPIEEKQTFFEKIPLLKFILPMTFFILFLLMLLLGTALENLTKDGPERFYNKNTLQENILKYSYKRLLGSMILQFNPFLNYMIKPNQYLSRIMRQLIITNYFLTYSAVSLLYFLARPDMILNGEVFWVSFLIQGTTLILRSKLQDCILSLFYPKSLTNWKYKSHQNEIQRKKSSHKKQQQEQNEQVYYPQVAQKQAVAEIEMMDLGDQGEQMQDSIRLDESAARLVNISKKYNQNEDQTPQGNEESPRGDEIVQYRKKKKDTQATLQTEKPKTKKKNKNIVQEQIQQEIELKDMRESKDFDGAINKEYQSYLESKNQQSSENSMKKMSNEPNDSNQPSKQYNNEFLNLDQDDDHYEGGDKEDDDYYYDDDQQHEEYKEQQQPKKPKKNAKKPKKNQDENDFDQVLTDHGIQDNTQQLTLDDLLDKYRTLDPLPVNVFKKLIGIFMMLLISLSLIIVHAVLMPNIYEGQFQNWFSCTCFSFVMMISFTDTILYMIIAKMLKSSDVLINRQRFCSKMTVILFFIGKWKFMELEIELAKLKDFDKEYGLQFQY